MAVILYPSNAEQDGETPKSLFSPTFRGAKVREAQRAAAQSRAKKFSPNPNEKWVVADGRFRLNSSYAPEHDVTLEQAIALPPILAAGAALAPEVAAAAAAAARFIKAGREIWIGEDARIAPFGNRTNHPVGRYPHYHRRGPAIDAKGNRPEGQSIKRHRPWEKKGSDTSFWDRF